MWRPHDAPLLSSLAPLVWPSLHLVHKLSIIRFPRLREVLPVDLMYGIAASPCNLQQARSQSDC